MRELITQEMIEKKNSKISSAELKVQSRNAKLAEFKEKQQIKSQNRYLKQKQKVENTIEKYSQKINKAKEKYTINGSRYTSLIESENSRFESKMSELKQKYENDKFMFERNSKIENQTHQKNIEKINFEYSDENGYCQQSLKKIVKFCESKIEFYTESLRLVEENNELTIKDINDGVQKAEELNVKFLVFPIQKKYAAINFKANMKLLKEDQKKKREELKSKLKETTDSQTIISLKDELKDLKNQYKKSVYEMWEESDKLYTPGVITTDLFFQGLGSKISKYFFNLGATFRSMKYWSFKDWLTFKVWGIPFYILAFACLIIGVSMGFGVIQTSMIYAFAILMTLAIVSGVIFEAIPIFNKYMGGAVIGCMIVGAVLVSTGVIGKTTDTYTTVKTWMDSQGFLDFYVSVLLIGAVLSIPRQMIIKSFGGFFSIIVIGSLGSVALGYLASIIMGIDLKDLLINYMLPILCAGNGGGVQPIDTMAKAHGIADWQSGALAISTIASIISILFAAILDSIGRSQPTLSGNGQLMKQDIHTASRKVKVDHRKIATSIFVVTIIFICSTFIAKKIITKDLVGIEIPNYAWMVVICLLINLLKLMPDDLKEASLATNKWIAKQTTWLLMVGVGICYIDLDKFLDALNPTSLFISFMFVLGSTLSIMLTAKLFKMNPIEAVLSGGLCMTAQGGTGVVSVLGVSNRMELMAFGQITCRIGGSLILVVAAGLFSAYY